MKRDFKKLTLYENVPTWTSGNTFECEWEHDDKICPECAGSGLLQDDKNTCLVYTCKYCAGKGVICHD